MIDPDFNPYELLIEALNQLNDHTDLLNRLIRAHNDQEQLMVDLTQQHLSVTKELVKTTKQLQEKLGNTYEIK